MDSSVIISNLWFSDRATDRRPMLRGKMTSYLERLRKHSRLFITRIIYRYHYRKFNLFPFSSSIITFDGKHEFGVHPFGLELERHNLYYYYTVLERGSKQRLGAPLCHHVRVLRSLLVGLSCWIICLFVYAISSSPSSASSLAFVVMIPRRVVGFVMKTILQCGMGPMDQVRA
jgi:hypothetical protein